MNTCTNLQLQQLAAHVQLCSICISLETHDLIPHPRTFKLTSEEKTTSGLAWRQTLANSARGQMVLHHLDYRPSFSIHKITSAFLST